MRDMMTRQKKNQQKKTTKFCAVAAAAVVESNGLVHGDNKNEVVVVGNGNGDASNDDVETSKTYVCGNAASYYLDVRILRDTQDIYNESFFRRYEFDDVQLNDH